MAAILLACAPAALVPAQEQKPGEEPVEVPIPKDREGERTLELTLGDALRLGRRNNTDLKVSELLPHQAAEDLRGARAIFEPELFADATVSRSEQPSRNVFQPQITRELYTATFGVRQLVSSGGSLDLSYSPTRLEQTSTVAGFPSRQFTSAFTASYRQPLLRSAWSDYTLSAIRVQESVLARETHRFGRTVQDTLLAIVQGYWELVFARENYRVVYQAFDLAREQLRITNERIRVRELAERDRVADEAEVARRQEDLIFAENEIRNREDALRRLLFDDEQGRLWRVDLRPISPIEIEPDPDPLEWRRAARSALLHRPDLKALRADVAISEQRLLTAERDVLPRLDLVGSYTTDGVEDTFSQAFRDSAEFEFPDWSLSLELSMPIGNNAALAARDRARLEVERTRRLLYSAEMDVTREVRDAVRDLRTLAESIQASRESVRLAEDDLDRERQKLRVGATTQFEVQRRNQALLEARTRLLRNQLDYHIAVARLLHVQGLLGVPEEDEDESGGEKK